MIVVKIDNPNPIPKMVTLQQEYGSAVIDQI